MGYDFRSGFCDQKIKTFWPDNTPTSLYIENNRLTLQEIIDKAKEHFGHDIDFNDLNISGEHIQTDCIGCDMYDPSDYTDFILLEKENGNPANWIPSTP